MVERRVTCRTFPECSWVPMPRLGGMRRPSDRTPRRWMILDCRLACKPCSMTRSHGATSHPPYVPAIREKVGSQTVPSTQSSLGIAGRISCATIASRNRCESHGGGKTIKLKYLCPRCEFNWRSCHNPKRPNVTRDDGCKDFWPRGKEKPPDTGKLSTAWIDGVDLSGLKKGKSRRLEK
jgi:hypothetical protein